MSGGFDVKVVKRAKKKAEENEGVLPAQVPTGPKPKEHLEERIPDLDPYIQTLVEEAKKGGYLTVASIRQELMSRHPELHAARAITKEHVRTSLKQLGYRYATRKAVWISRRESPEVLGFY